MRDGSARTAGEGAPRASGRRFCLVVSRYHGEVTGRLERGAREALESAGAAAGDVEVLEVPGAWELPWAARRAARTGRFDAIVALGCVVRGATPHFDYVCRGATDGLGRIASEGGPPVGFGLLTCDDLEQALERAGGAEGNKGAEAARAVLELCELADRLPAAPTARVP